MPNYRAIARTAARKYGIPEQVFLRQINQESGFNPSAHSSAGATGIAQFMPATAREYGVNPNDPVSSLMGAAKYDKMLLDKYGSMARALSAYNSGRPDAYQDPNFAHGQTYNYVKSIMGGKDILVGNGGKGGAVPSAPMGVPMGGNFNNLVASVLLGAAQNGGQMDPGSLMSLVLARQQYGAANSVYGSQKAPNAMGGTAGTFSSSGNAGGFLPAGAMYKKGRKDQGRDGQTNPGGPIISPGEGVVVDVKSDPNGFGPSYPVIKYTSGPYAGRTVYVGHTIAAVQPGQRVRKGQVISRTSSHGGLGNATTPGWFEIGYAPGGTPGSWGQPIPF